MINKALDNVKKVFCTLILDYTEMIIVKKPRTHSKYYLVGYGKDVEAYVRFNGYVEIFFWQTDSVVRFNLSKEEIDKIIPVLKTKWEETLSILDC